MKRLSIVAVGVLALLVIGSASMAIGAKGDKKIVKTKVSLAFTPAGTSPYDENYNEAKFTGRAKTKKVCRGGRKVTIPEIGKAKTNRRGNFSISAGSTVAPGKYQATVKKKVVKKKKGKKVICKKAKSPKVTVS